MSDLTDPTNPTNLIDLMSYASLLRGARRQLDRYNGDVEQAFIRKSQGTLYIDVYADLVDKYENAAVKYQQLVDEFLIRGDNVERSLLGSQPLLPANQTADFVRWWPEVRAEFNGQEY